MNDRPKGHPEPEIIPPGQRSRAETEPRWGDPRSAGNTRVWMWSSDRSGAHLRAGRPGPLGLVLIFAAVAALGALGFFVFLGALAITVPIVAALVLAGLIASLLRRL